MSASETIERVVHGDADVQIGQPRRRLSGLRSRENGWAKFGFDRRMKGTATVSDWKAVRFATKYPGRTCRVLNGDGTEAHGNTALSTVRASYEEGAGT
jgi:hypothetical protein